MNRAKLLRYTGLIAAALALHVVDASAGDNLKLTIGQRGNWDTAIAHIGSRAGIFRKHGLELEMLYTSGSGETLQPVIAGSADLGLAVGTQGAMSAYAKGAPVRIVGAQSEEHTSELQSQSNLVCRLLLEKKKK